jgi:ribosomal protein L7Ae-like RNA K-turn-binding protein
MPIIPATWDIGDRRVTVQGSPRQKQKTVPEKITKSKKELGAWLHWKHEVLSSNSSTEKKISRKD